MIWLRSKIQILAPPFVRWLTAIAQIEIRRGLGAGLTPPCSPVKNHCCATIDNSSRAATVAVLVVVVLVAYFSSTLLFIYSVISKISHSSHCSFLGNRTSTNTNLTLSPLYIRPKNNTFLVVYFYTSTK